MDFRVCPSADANGREPLLKRIFTAAIAALMLGASSVFGAGSAKADGKDIIGTIIIGGGISGLIIAATHDDGHHAHRAPKRRHQGHYKRKPNKHSHCQRGPYYCVAGFCKSTL